MSSLYIDRRDVELRLDSGAIAIYENEERVGTIPLAPIDRVLIRGNALIRVNLLAELGKKGVGVVFLSGRKAEPTLLMPTPHNDAQRRVAQYDKSQDKSFCFKFTKCLVEAKIQAQLELLEQECVNRPIFRYEIRSQINKIKELQRSIGDYANIASLRGLEGKVSAEYFASFATFLPISLCFKGRNRRPPRDPFNAVLSLGYTLLHADAVTSLYAAGLDPYIGFYHTLDFARQSLACDFVEPFRPLIDRFAIDCFKNKTLRPEGFSMTDQGCLMNKQTRIDFYLLYEEIAETLRKKLSNCAYDLVHVLVPHCNGEFISIDKTNEL